MSKINSNRADAQNQINLPPVLAQYDYIIVGAGSAGCVIARRLIDETNATVLLLEAGGPNNGIETISKPSLWVHNMGSAYDYNYAYEPSPAVNNRVIPSPRGKVMGGSGSINGITWTRGNKADYDNWAAAGNVGWDYESVLPLFRKIEDWEGGASAFHGEGGPIHVGKAKNINFSSTAFIAACESYGMPFMPDANGPEPEGVGVLVTNVKDGERSGPTAYLKPVMQADRLTILTHAKVLKLKLKESHCTGVELEWNGNVHIISAAKEVILSAGAIDSPRILMLSGIGHADELTQLGIQAQLHLPGVGQNFQDHILIASLCFETHDPIGIPNNNLVDSLAYWKSDQQLALPDLMFLSIHAPFISTEIARQYQIPENLFCLVPGLVKPKSKGYIKMKSTSHDGLLEIQPNFLKEPEDLQALINAVEIGMELAEQPALKNIIKKWSATPVKHDKKGIETFVRNATSSYYHPVGTCAMGYGSDAVVDSQLRLHGLTGLRVADASIMPEITSCNTHAPVLMIAEFAAKAIIASI